MSFIRADQDIVFFFFFLSFFLEMEKLARLSLKTLLW